MPLKRQIDHSSNSLSEYVASATSTAGSSSLAKLLKRCTADTAEQSELKNLTVASSEVRQSVDLTDQGKLGGFLKQCPYCRKTVAKDSEIFIDLYAFCCVECRDLQIMIDDFAGKDIGEADENLLQEVNKMNILPMKKN